MGGIGPAGNRPPHLVGAADTIPDKFVSQTGAETLDIAPHPVSCWRQHQHEGETMRTTTLFAALPLIALFAGTAAAQEAACTKQLKMLDEIQMESRGVGPSTVPVEINGTKHNLTFSTTSPYTQVSEATAKSLGLTVAEEQVTVNTLTFGKLEGTNVKMPVMGGGGRGGAGGPGGAAGRFGLNHMLSYDVDVDFGTDTLKFFDQDHCPGGVLYWQASVVGVMPITISNGRVTVPVMIDGKELTGVIDTTAMGLSVKEAVAEKILGLEAGMEGKTHTGTLALGTIGLKNTRFNIVTNGAQVGGSATASAINRSAAVQFALAQPEVVIGMDLLRKLHLYMAFGEKKLYITPASPRPAAATAN